MARKGRLKTNLFVKPNAQRQSREDLSDAMARKGRMKFNEKDSHAAMCSMLSTSWQICLYSAVIPLRGFSTRAKVLKFKHIPSPLPHFFARRPHFSFVFAHLYNGLCNNFVFSSFSGPCCIYTSFLTLWHPFRRSSEGRTSNTADVPLYCRLTNSRIVNRHIASSDFLHYLFLKRISPFVHVSPRNTNLTKHCFVQKKS